MANEILDSEKPTEPKLKSLLGRSPPTPAPPGSSQNPMAPHAHPRDGGGGGGAGAEDLDLRWGELRGAGEVDPQLGNRTGADLITFL